MYFLDRNSTTSKRGESQPSDRKRKPMDASSFRFPHEHHVKPTDSISAMKINTESASDIKPSVPEQLERRCQHTFGPESPSQAVLSWLFSSDDLPSRLWLASLPLKGPETNEDPNIDEGNWSSNSFAPQNSVTFALDRQGSYFRCPSSSSLLSVRLGQISSEKSNWDVSGGSRERPYSPLLDILNYSNLQIWI